MESITDDNRIIEDNLKIKVYGLELQLLVADKAMASYRKLSQDQQKRIDMLLTRMNEIILLTQEAIDNHY